MPIHAQATPTCVAANVHSTPVMASKSMAINRGMTSIAHGMAPSLNPNTAPARENSTNSAGGTNSADPPIRRTMRKMTRSATPVRIRTPNDPPMTSM